MPPALLVAVQGVNVLARVGEINFATPIARALLRDARLSFSARGLFAFLWDLPAGWCPNIAHLTTMGPDGRDAVRARLAELEQVGALRIEPIRLPDGTCRGKRWVLHAPELWAQEAALAGGDTEERETRSSVKPTFGKPVAKVHQPQGSSRFKVPPPPAPEVSFPRNFVFQEMGYNAPVNWKEKRS